MRFTRQQPVFENRYDAGRQLAAKLNEYKSKSAVVLAIPNGGVLVALNVALALEADEFNLIISRKIPLPLTPEGGFGAVTDDGTTILNEEVVKRFGLSPQQINYQVSQVRANIRQRSLLYRKDRPPSVVKGKTVIIIDDGLASGYTMMAAVESIRYRQPREIIVAVPVASATALKKVEKIADRVIAGVAGFGPEFYVSDFYRYWHEPSDNEVVQCFKEWGMRHRPDIEALGKK
ncbi:MAG: phosphoribosyl transferase [Dehalococcoidia bacterium]|nr:MAG: phosphoribosyl transferase [Dehalococcoidia bacterium]